MPTNDFSAICPICLKAVSEHSIEELDVCYESLGGQIKTLKRIERFLFEQKLVKEQPERLTNGRHCYKCGCHLPGNWGDEPAYPKVPGYPDARMCGQCLREIPHNCHENVRHISGADSYMGSRDGYDYYECAICGRGIDVSEFVKVKEK